MTRRICSVCSVLIEEVDDGYDIDSHGFCADHIVTKNQEYDEWEREYREQEQQRKEERKKRWW